MRTIYALLALGLVACGPEKDDTGDGPQADADTDADADSDTDADGDTDVGPGDGCEEGSIPEAWPEVIDEVEVHLVWGGDNAALGDVNGDGYDDIALDDALVLLGPLCPGLDPGDEGLIQAEVEVRSRFGYQHLNGAGDVDADGLADILVGDDWADDFTGEVFLAVSPLEGEAYMPDVAVADIVGETPYGYFGGAVAGVGDVDGDGVPDLLAGAKYEEGGGAAWLISGTTRGYHTVSDVGVAVRGSEDYPTVGYALAALGDTDGDGLDDFLVGTSSAIESPGVALVRGPLVTDLAFEEADAVFLPHPDADEFGDGFGASISSVGNQDGDGLPDVAIGAPVATVSVEDEGAIYIFAGSVSGKLDGSQARTVLTGELEHSYAGSSVDSAGDVNGDGQTDLAIGAEGWNPGGDSLGAVYLVFGPVIEGSLPLADADVVLVGTYQGEYPDLGQVVLGAGDTNGDGLDDVLLTGWDRRAQFHSHLLLGR
ncbi:MAG: integrin alpha [Pseudomonadota bacterium]